MFEIILSIYRNLAHLVVNIAVGIPSRNFWKTAIIWLSQRVIPNLVWNMSLCIEFRESDCLLLILALIVNITLIDETLSFILVLEKPCGEFRFFKHLYGILNCKRGKLIITVCWVSKVVSRVFPSKNLIRNITWSVQMVKYLFGIILVPSIRLFAST